MKKALWLLPVLCPLLSPGQISINEVLINSDPFGIEIGSFTQFKGKTYFFADDEVHGMEPWVYGDETPIHMLADIWPGSYGSIMHPDFRKFCVADDKLFFAARDGVNGSALYQYDGINAPVLAPGITPAAVYKSSEPEYLTELNGKVYYAASNNAELKVYDPVAQTETKLNAGVARGISHIIAFKGKLVFQANGPNYFELYEYDPAADKTSLVAGYDLFGYSGSPFGFTILKDKLYFISDGTDYGHEVYEYDGVNKPVRITDINPGKEHSTIVGGHSQHDVTVMAAFNGNLYFAANNTSTPWTYNLFKYDPDAKNLSEVFKLNAPGLLAPRHMAVYARKLFFSADTALNKPGTLYVYDGVADPYRLETLGLPYPFSDPQRLAVSNGRLFFTATGLKGNNVYILSDPIGLSTKDVLPAAEVELYPNPAGDKTTLTIAVKAPARLSFSICDMLGREVYRSGTREYKAEKTVLTIPTSGFAPGCYIYRVSSDDGVILKNGRLVKQ